MKWIKSRKLFLNEAKIKDVLKPRQLKEVKRIWSEKYLEYDEVEPTDRINQGKWKLSEEDKMRVLSYFFGSEDRPIDMEKVFDTFKNLDDKFVNVLKESVDVDLLNEKLSDKKYAKLLENFNPKEPTIDQISIITSSVFRNLSVSETKGGSYVKKDENNRPIRDEEGNLIRVEKEKGDPVFERNLVNINTFVSSYNRAYDSDIDDGIFRNRDISNLISFASENHNHEYKFDFQIFDKDLYLSINHNAQDILNMAISKFFSSCQHLYSGSYRSQLIGNVFDPNSIPAFLIFDTPIFWENDTISDFLPLSRMIIRNVEPFSEDDEGSKIFFDRCYPDRLKTIMDEMVEKYSKNKDEDIQGRYYLFTPDVDLEDSISEPYMDRMGIRKLPYIGINAKSININRNFDWSKVKISPKAKIKELVIENDKLPENLTQLKLNPDWIKFRFIKINDLSKFEFLVTDSVAFDKCSIDVKVINQWPNADKIKNLQVIACDMSGEFKLEGFSNLEELHLVYTLEDYTEVENVISGLDLKKLVISGDLMTKESKEFFNGLKSKGIKIETVGPVV